MAEDAVQGELRVGELLVAPGRMMTRERMRWYCNALETATDADGEFKIAAPTIHTDDEYARSQGLPGIIADGMISTNWISSLLVRHFGLDYIAHGELRTKFVRPIYEDEIIETFGKVASVEQTEAGRQVVLEVWCSTSSGELCTTGEARVPVGG